MAHDDAALHAQMTALVAELAPDEGMTPSLLEGVAFGRSSRSLPRTPVLHDACIVIVCSGRKRGYFGDQVIEYGAHQFMDGAVTELERGADDDPHGDEAADHQRLH